MFETLLPKDSHEFSSHSRNDAKEEQDGCVSDPRQLNQQIRDHMGNQFPFTTESFKQAVNLAGTVLAIWSLSLGIVHCFDLFGMIYSFNVLRGKKFGSNSDANLWCFCQKLSRRPSNVFFLNQGQKKKKSKHSSFLNSFAAFTRLVQV